MKAIGPVEDVDKAGRPCGVAGLVPTPFDPSIRLSPTLWIAGTKAKAPERLKVSLTHPGTSAGADRAFPILSTTAGASKRRAPGMWVNRW